MKKADSHSRESANIVSKLEKFAQISRTFRRISFALLSKSVAACQMNSAMRSISGAPKPRVVTAGVPMRMPEVTNGLPGRSGWHLVGGDVYFVQTALQLLAGHAGLSQVDEHQVVVRAAADQIKALLLECVREHAGHWVTTFC